MAYSRFSYSDIYIYPSVLGDICCSACMLVDKSVYLSSDEEIISHIQEHRDKGHNIPKNLEKDILEDSDRFVPFESLATKTFKDIVCKDCESTENSKK